MQPGSGPEVEIALSARLLAQRRPAAALTGAGLSTRSGIPDFRSPGTGLWLEHHKAESYMHPLLRCRVGHPAADPVSAGGRFQEATMERKAAVPGN